MDAALLGKALLVATLGITQLASMTLVLGFALALLGDAPFAFALVDAPALAPVGLATLVGIATLVGTATLVGIATLVRGAGLVRNVALSGIPTLFRNALALLRNAAPSGIVALIRGAALRCFAAPRGFPLRHLALLCLALCGLALLRVFARSRRPLLPGIALPRRRITALPGCLFWATLALAGAIAATRGLVALALFVRALARLASRLLPSGAVVIVLMRARLARTLQRVGRCRKRDPDRQHDREEHGDWMQGHCGAPWSRSPPLHGAHA
ncbi:hypothetical protein [Luteimonas sp. A501]